MGFWTWAAGACEGAERLRRGERRGEEKDGLVLFITLYSWLTQLFENTASPASMERAARPISRPHHGGSIKVSFGPPLGPLDVLSDRPGHWIGQSSMEAPDLGQ